MAGFAAWKTAARVHTLPAAVVPVMVGAGLALGDGVFRWDAFAWALVGAVAIQVAANFANDASDARRGADTPDRIGPPRMVALGMITSRAMWAATWGAITIAAVAGVALTLIAGPAILLVGAVSVIAMLAYVGGPAPYGYRGLGEVFVFIFFGLVATVGSRFVHDGTAPLAAWLVAIPIGLLATAILVVNNLRDIDTDRSAGKRTLAVILGERRTRAMFALLLYGSLTLLAVYVLLGLVPRGTMLAVLVIPQVSLLVRMVRRGERGADLIRALELTARAHLYTGLAIAIGAALRL